MIPYGRNIERCYINDEDINICKKQLINKNISDHPYVIDKDNTCITFNTNHCYYKIEEIIKYRLSVDSEDLCNNKNKILLKLIGILISKHTNFFILIQECSKELLQLIENFIISTDFKSCETLRPINYINKNHTAVAPILIDSSLDNSSGLCTARDFDNYNVTLYNSTLYEFSEVHEISSNGRNVQFEKHTDKCENSSEAIKMPPEERAFNRHHALKLKKKKKV